MKHLSVYLNHNKTWCGRDLQQGSHVPWCVFELLDNCKIFLSKAVHLKRPKSLLMIKRCWSDLQPPPPKASPSLCDRSSLPTAGARSPEDSRTFLCWKGLTGRSWKTRMFVDIVCFRLLLGCFGTNALQWYILSRQISIDFVSMVVIVKLLMCIADWLWWNIKGDVFSFEDDIAKIIIVKVQDI